MTKLQLQLLTKLGNAKIFASEFLLLGVEYNRFTLCFGSKENTRPTIVVISDVEMSKCRLMHTAQSSVLLGTQHISLAKSAFRHLKCQQLSAGY